MAPQSQGPVMLVDGTAFLYRAYHALPPLTSSAGEPTGAIFGVLNSLRRLLAQHAPSRIAVVFDAAGGSFRDELYAQYKAHRPPMPDELAAQTEPLRAIVRALGLPVLVIPGVEADDVIGTLALRCAADGATVLVCTADKDMAQLVDERIELFNMMTDTRLDARGVEEKFGVPPRCMADWLALVGDSSDNIPGVPKVGPKTAAKWLHEYGSLDALLANADAIAGKVGENLRAYREQLALSRRLATIRTDVALPIAIDALQLGPPDTAALRDWYTRLGFRHWLAQLDESTNASASAEPTSGAAAQTQYRALITEAEFLQWLPCLNDAELVSFDTETTGLDYMSAELVGFSFAVQPHEAVYIPVGHTELAAATQLPLPWVLERLRNFLTDPERPKLGHNLKYDMSVLARYGIELAGIAHDSMLESYVLDSTAVRHDMDSLAQRYLGQQTITYEQVTGKGAKQIPFSAVPLEQATRYAAEDADVTLRLHAHFWPRLTALPDLHRVYAEIEVPLIPVLSRMERNGVRIDCDMLRLQSAELGRRILELEQAAQSEAGVPFNLGSPKQIQDVLFERLQLPVMERTPTGQPSTAESALQALAEAYALPRLILQHRSLSKLKSTYTDKLAGLVHPQTGRVHTSYQQAVAATGRLSSSDPNLQNIPARTEEGRRIRRAFVAEPGCQLITADYSQIELRIMAHLADEPALKEAFAHNQDIHATTAAEVFGVALAAVQPDQRRAAKAINFGLIYGMSPFGLARQLGIDRRAADSYVERYFARYPRVRDYMNNTRRLAHEQGYVETVYGRRLYLPDIRAANSQRRQAAERAAINAPMQGTAADIIKRAMLTMDAWLRQQRAPARMILQVHDELVFEVADAAVDEVAAAARQCMAGAAELTVPLVVDIGIATNWDDAH